MPNNYSNIYNLNKTLSKFIEFNKNEIEIEELFNLILNLDILSNFDKEEKYDIFSKEESIINETSTVVKEKIEIPIIQEKKKSVNLKRTYPFKPKSLIYYR